MARLRPPSVCGSLRAQAREAELIRLVEERTSQLQQANDHLQRLSYIDSLTGIANRRHFEEILENEWRRAFRAKTPMTLLMLDIDQFKLYNDTFGHRAGDRCLTRVAKVLDESVQRAGDLMARYGGEEFAAILTVTDESGGAEVAERLRAAVEQLGIKLGDGSSQVVTISVGVAAGIPGQVSILEITPDRRGQGPVRRQAGGPKPGRHGVRPALQRPDQVRRPSTAI